MAAVVRAPSRGASSRASRSSAELTPDTLRTEDMALARCPTCGERYPSDYVVCPKDATPMGSTAADPMLGAVLAGSYRVVRALGRGGMGKLYEAQHARLD